MLRVTTAVVMALVLGGVATYSQSQNLFDAVAFELTLSGRAHDMGNAVVELDDGGYAVVGYTEFPGVTGVDVYLIRLTAAGDTVWTRTYDNRGNDHGWDLTPTDDGGFTIVGFTDRTASGEDDVLLLHTDSAGKLEWSKTFGYERGDLAWSMQPVPGGDMVIAAQSARSDDGDIDAYLLRVDSGGDLIWSQRVGGPGIDRVFSVTAMTAGRFAFTGFSTATLDAPRDVYVVCVDSLGTVLWEKRFEGPALDTGHGITAAGDGVLVSAYGASLGAGGNDVYLIRLTAEGEVLWRREIGGPGDDRAMMSAPRPGGGFVTIGYSDRLGDWDIYLIETDDDGNVLSESLQKRPGRDRGVMVRGTRDGGYIITGGIMPPPSEKFDLIVTRVNASSRP